MTQIETVLTTLQSQKRSISCKGKTGLLALLESLGFSMAQGQANHYVFTHAELSALTEFTTFSIDCGHQPKKPMKLPYVVKTISIIRQYQTELTQILDEPTAEESAEQGKTQP